jgi:hypothetical protein
MGCGVAMRRENHQDTKARRRASAWLGAGTLGGDRAARGGAGRDSCGDWDEMGITSQRPAGMGTRWESRPSGFHAATVGVAATIQSVTCRENRQNAGIGCKRGEGRSYNERGVAARGA